MKKPAKTPFDGKGDHDGNGNTGGAHAPVEADEAEAKPAKPFGLVITPNEPAPAESWGERQARESIEAEKALAAKKDA